MKQNQKRLWAWLLSLALFIAAAVSSPAQISVQASVAQTSTAVVQAAQERSVQEGLTLQCWNWSYANIEANMGKIAEQGYTAIQTSPIQQAKESTSGKTVGGHWWVYYQPAAFAIDNTGNSALGTKAEFEKMCKTAHSYGIKVIVDVVANHMGNRTGNNLADTITPDIKNDSSCWHDISKNTTDYSSRYNITQYCMDGLPDLNTSNKKVQNYVLNFLKECIDSGADGFRFDAAKHIETPDDSSSGCGSDFWPTVINGAKSYASSTRGIDLYCYGEVLDKPDSSGKLPVSAYTKYMSVTDNEQGNNLRGYVQSGNATSAGSPSYCKNTTAKHLVLWAESHDTYAGNQSSSVSTANINKTWALVAARADAMGLYFARPNSGSTKLGAADKTGWSYSEVGAVNKFHNTFAGQTEYMASENGIAYCERGTSGVVLVNCNGTNCSVNVKANKIKDGTYKDQISNTTFKVSNGRITGNIGSTGIAVVYNVSVKPEVTLSQKGGTFSSDTLSLTATLSNATSGTYKIGNKSAVTFSGSKKFIIGADMKVGDKVVVKLTATKGSETTSESYEFEKVEKSDNVAYIKLPSGWGSRVYCYAYDSETEKVTNGAWPGVAMTSVGNGVYSYEVPENIKNPRVIFYSSDSCRYPADMQPGLLLKGSMIYKDGSWISYQEQVYGKVTVKYVDQSGKSLADIVTTTGKVGESYKTSAKSISGYELVEVSGNASGVYTEGTITVKYIYKTSAVTTSNVAYIEKPSGWGSKVYCYAYSEKNESNKNSSWPGVEMTKVSGNIYKYEVPVKISDPLVIFTDGKNQYPASMQKGLDLSGKMIYRNGKWKKYETTTTANVAYIAKDSSWGSKMYCYVYSADNSGSKNASWPGVAMTKVAGNIYKYEVPDNIKNPRIIFTDGQSQYPGAMKEGLTITGSMIYENGKWISYKE